MGRPRTVVASPMISPGARRSWMSRIWPMQTGRGRHSRPEMNLRPQFRLRAVERQPVPCVEPEPAHRQPNRLGMELGEIGQVELHAGVGDPNARPVRADDLALPDSRAGLKGVRGLSDAAR